ncbi:MAG: hypothetical protein U0414_37525 [Polyangiaceae bacterium]
MEHRAPSPPLSPSRRAARWASSALPFVLAAGLVAACGDSGAGTTGAPPTATTAAKSSTPIASGSTAPAATSASATPSAAPSGSASSAPSASASASASSAAPASSIPPVSAASSSGEVKGEEKSAPAYTAYMGGAKSYKAGQSGALFVVVSALEGYHVNPTYKYKMKMNAAPAGVSFASDTVTDVSRSEKQATMSVPFTPSQAGSYTLTGTCSLSVCTDTTCVVDKVPLSVTVKVE